MIAEFGKRGEGGGREVGREGGREGGGGLVYIQVVFSISFLFIYLLCFCLFRRDGFELGEEVCCEVCCFTKEGLRLRFGYSRFNYGRTNETNELTNGTGEKKKP